MIERSDMFRRTSDDTGTLNVFRITKNYGKRYYNGWISRYFGKGNVKMKKFLIILIFALTVPTMVFAKKKTSDEGQAKISFTETVWDFGTIPENKGGVSHDFEFVNAGNGNLVILDATAECGCTRPEYPKSPVAPGKKQKVKVTYNPLGRPGSFEKTVTIKTNGSPKKTRLKIRGIVAAGK